MKKSTKANVLIVVGGLLAVIGIVLLATYALIFQAVLENYLVIEDGTELYESWVAPPVEVGFEVYFFNVTNPYDIVENEATPELQEIGPYYYKEIFLKKNLEFYDDEGTVEYSETKTYFFDESRSVGTEDDIVTTGNFIMILLAAKMYDNRMFRRFIWPEIDEKMQIFENHTVGEILFHGYDLPVFDFDIPLVDGTEGTLYEILVNLGMDPPDIVKNNKFALLALSNGTLGVRYKVNTGENGMDDYLFIQEYNGNPELTYWNDTYCDMINGSDGTQYPPFRKKEDIPRLFISQFCRSLYFEFDKEVKVWDKVKAHRYIPPDELLEDPKTSAANACFCNKVYEEDEEECLGSSFINLAPCAAGLPIILSTPHFFQGDEKELAKINGLYPDADKHQTFLSIDPVTGVVMSAAKRIQFNLPLRKYKKLSTFDNVPEVILPIFWINEAADISEEDADSLAKMLTIVFAVGYTLFAVIMVVGIVMMGFGFKTDKNVLHL